MKLFLLIVLALLAVSCGKSSSSNAPKVITISEDQINTVVNSQVISCPTEGCPEGVGRMFTLNKKNMHKSMVCSSFLIDSRTVMTNSHCAYLSGVDLTETCNGIYFVFPERDGSYHQARCSKILWRDPGQGNDHYFRSTDKDFAIIKLDQDLPIEPMELKSAVLEPGQTVYPLVVDQSGLYHSRFLKLKCTVASVDENNGITVVSNCPIISGNSGSAVVDESNSVVAIIAASSDADVRKPGVYSEVKTYQTNGFGHTMSYIRNMLGRFLN